MYMILHSESENEVCQKASILELEKAITVWNVAHLRQSVEFIKSSTTKSETCTIDAVLDIIKKRLDMDDSEDTKRNCEHAMIYIFDLLMYFLETNPSSPIEDIQSLALEWLNNESTCVSAIMTLSHIAAKCKENDPSIIINNLPTKFVLQSKNTKLKCVFLQLIKILMQNITTFILDDETLDKIVECFDMNDYTAINTELFLCIACKFFKNYFFFLKRYSHFLLKKNNFNFS